MIKHLAILILLTQSACAQPSKGSGGGSNINARCNYAGPEPVSIKPFRHICDTCSGANGNEQRVLPWKSTTQKSWGMNTVKLHPETILIFCHDTVWVDDNGNEWQVVFSNKNH